MSTRQRPRRGQRVTKHGVARCEITAQRIRAMPMGIPATDLKCDVKLLGLSARTVSKRFAAVRYQFSGQTKRGLCQQ